jgi:exosortase F-associated protein
MLQKLFSNRLRVIQLGFLVGLFALIRSFEDQLFYDPFLDFFKAENTSNYPVYNSVRLYLHLIFRYFLNSLISLLLLYVIFKDLHIIKFTAFLFSFFFLFLLFTFFIVLNYFDESHKMILFYIRRFIIQPIFILLFIPAFYFQKKVIDL